MDKLQADKRRIERVKYQMQNCMPEFARRFFRDNIGVMAASSMEGYANDLVAFFGYLDSIGKDSMSMTLFDLNHISSSLIEDFLDYSSTRIVKGEVKKRSGAAIARRYSVLSSFFEYYYRKGLITSNPVTKLSRPSENRKYYAVKNAPGIDITARLLEFVATGTLPGKHAAALQWQTRTRDTAILMLIIGAGLKPSEIIEINIDDIDLKKNSILVHGRTIRTVFISEPIAKAVSAYMSERLSVISFKGSDNAMFLSVKGTRLSVRSLQYMVQKYTTALLGNEAEKIYTAHDYVKSFRNNIFDNCPSRTGYSRITGTTEDYDFRLYKGYIEEYERYKARDFKV